jgi:hypothetical protein
MTYYSQTAEDQGEEKISESENNNEKYNRLSSEICESEDRRMTS